MPAGTSSRLLIQVDIVLIQFFLILLIGVRETAYLAGAVNFLIAGLAFALSRRAEAVEPTAGAPEATVHATAVRAQDDAGGLPPDAGTEVAPPSGGEGSPAPLSPALAGRTRTAA